MKKDYSFLFIIVVLYILVRSVNFTRHLNFSSEQASFTLKARQLLENKKIELIGPPISWRYGERYFFQGSITYYAMIPLLILGNWDPIVSSYMMVLLGAIMLVPLYYGAKLLFNQKSAEILSYIFCFFPLFIDYSRFFWNPNLQLIFTPIIILWMGLFKKYQKTIFLFLVSLFSGILMLFHYQFFLVILGIFLYYFFFNKLSLKQKITFIIGIPIGFSPLIVFELRNQFYNLNTLYLFILHFNTVFIKKNQTFSLYYLLSILLFIFLFISPHISHISKKILFILGVVLCVIITICYSVVPSSGFGMAKNWNYGMELQAHEIIKKNLVSNYNIVNLGYDTIAIVQKYLLIKDNIKGLSDDYYLNKYLYVITNKQDIMKNPAYEINTFTPNRIINSWKLNDKYTVYLLERL